MVFVSVFHNYVLIACFCHQVSIVGYIRHTRIVFTNPRKFVNQVFCLQKCTDLWYSTCSVYKKIEIETVHLVLVSTILSAATVAKVL